MDDLIPFFVLIAVAVASAGFGYWVSRVSMTASELHIANLEKRLTATECERDDAIEKWLSHANSR